MLISLLAIFVFGCLALVAYSYVGYPILLHIWDRVDPPQPFPQTDELPPVSILISAFNEEQHIGARIQNCLALNYPADRLEILVGSDGSDDRTNAVVTEMSDPRVRLFPFARRRGKVNVLNDLAEEANGDILVFTDANTHFHRDALRMLVRHLPVGGPVGCVCGKLTFTDPDGQPTIADEGAYWRLETFLKTREGKRGSLLGANGAIFAMPKSLYEPCRPDTIVEDFVIPLRLLTGSHRVIFEPEAEAFEEAPALTRDEFRRRVRIGAGAFQAFSRHITLLHPRNGFSAFAFLSHKVLRWLTPFLLITALAGSVALASQGTFAWLLILQLAFLALAAVGFATEPWGIRTRIFSLPHYFLTMNLALAIGFFGWATGSQKTTWKRTPRNTRVTAQSGET